MLAVTSRRMTGEERAALEARRAGLVAKYSKQEERLDRARDGTSGSMLWLVGVFALLTLYNFQAGRVVVALVTGVMALSLGIVLLRRFEGAPLSVLDRPPIMRLDQALVANETRVIDITADAAVTLRGVDDEGGQVILGDLLRTGADQVVYVPRDLCAGVDPDRLPNTALRFTFCENLELVRVEALGERCDPLAMVQDSSAPDDPLWRSEMEIIVWTPGEDRFALLELGSGELTPYELDLDFRRLTAALTSRIYR